VIIRAGTSGFQYKGWKGYFYPEKIANADMLTYYSKQLPTVELNNTFYRMPKREVVAKWAEQTTDDFRFVLKASRRISHVKRLKDPDEPLAFLYRSIAELGDKHGATLFQLPPNAKQNLDRLRTFFEALPDQHHAVMEFRNPSWFVKETYDLMSEFGVGLCMSDSEETPLTDIVATAALGYLRLRRMDYDKAQLERFAEQIRAQSWTEAYVFFKHEDEGAGPRMAGRFLEMLA